MEVANDAKYLPDMSDERALVRLESLPLVKYAANESPQGHNEQMLSREECTERVQSR
jgi:hypothetical protein